MNRLASGSRRDELRVSGGLSLRRGGGGQAIGGNPPADPGTAAERSFWALLDGDWPLYDHIEVIPVGADGWQFPEGAQWISAKAMEVKEIRGLAGRYVRMVHVGPDDYRFDFRRKNAGTSGFCVKVRRCGGHNSGDLYFWEDAVGARVEIRGIPGVGTLVNYADKRGLACFRPLPDGDYPIHISLSPWQPVSGTLHVENGQYSIPGISSFGANVTLGVLPDEICLCCRTAPMKRKKFITCKYGTFEMALMNSEDSSSAVHPEDNPPSFGLHWRIDINPYESEAVRETICSPGIYAYETLGDTIPITYIVKCYVDHWRVFKFLKSVRVSYCAGGTGPFRLTKFNVPEGAGGAGAIFSGAQAADSCAPVSVAVYLDGSGYYNSAGILSNSYTVVPIGSTETVVVSD